MRLLILIALILVAGCGAEMPPDLLEDVDVSDIRFSDSVEAALTAPHTIELMSIDPKNRKKSEGESIGLWKILGKCELTAEEEGLVIKAWRAGVALKPRPAACFEPRHALRIHAESGDIDVLICFACEQLVVYGAGSEPGSAISHRPQSLFNKLLRDHKVPLAHN